MTPMPDALKAAFNELKAIDGITYASVKIARRVYRDWLDKHLPVVRHCLNSAMQTEALQAENQRLREALNYGLQLKGGWREAVQELEDWCHESVRLQNMEAALNQMDRWEQRARDALGGGE